MMEINAIIIFCACEIGLHHPRPQAHFSPACHRVLGTWRQDPRWVEGPE